MVDAPSETLAVVESVYRAESSRVLATLIRLLGDFDLAEDALQDAFSAALEHWCRHGVPANPRAWLVSTGRFRAIDKLRRQARLASYRDQLAPMQEGASPEFNDEDTWDDDRLRLIFTCCHPALPPDAQVALTLREVCGLTTEEIARAFLVPTPTIAKRIVRAKTLIREQKIPYEVPAAPQLDARLEAVLRVIYLVFNEGYAASAGEALVRPELADEAIRLGRLLVHLLPDPEAISLLALMLLQHSRRAARLSADGDLVLLEDQDRTHWDPVMIREGLELVRGVWSSRQVGPYALQAAIAAVHSEAKVAPDTDWDEIVGLYSVLLRADPSPVVELNRAVAVAMRDGPAAGLDLIVQLLQRGALANYHHAHVAKGELHRRLGQLAEARASFERALELTRLEPERRLLEHRLHELRGR
jgi:RNA polymerase sigma-70 factor, ECF subfamily